MNRKILIAIATVILVSGCIEIPGMPTSQMGLGGLGLEITSFTAEPSPIFSGASLRVIMEAENRGGTSVNNSDALVYLTSANWGSWAGNTSSFKTFGKEMKAEDVVRGVPATTDRLTWSLTAPSLSPGQTRSDIFIGRIYHEYETSANGNIWVYSEAEAEAARAAGRQIYTPSFTYSKGPVGIQVTVSPTPVILYAGENSFTVYVKISNLASGTIYSPGAVGYSSNDISLTVDEINRVDVDVTAPGLSGFSECEGTDQELIAGRDLTLVCDVTVTSVPDTFQSYQFDVKVSYGYYTERTTTVTVQGR